MRKATIIIWRNRHRPEVISELADLLSEVRDEAVVWCSVDRGSTVGGLEFCSIYC